MPEENRIALLGIVVEDISSSDAINQLLHECGDFIVGRMGIPYRKKGISIIRVVLDAPQNFTSALSGKLGMLPGVNVKTIYARNNITQ